MISNSCPVADFGISTTQKSGLVNSLSCALINDDLPVPRAPPEQGVVGWFALQKLGSVPAHQILLPIYM